MRLAFGDVRISCTRARIQAAALGRSNIPRSYSSTAAGKSSGCAASAYADRSLPDADVQRAADLIEQTSAQRWVHQYGRQQADLVLGHLARAQPSHHGAELLTELAEFVVDRDA
ncbi:hypothetical protein ACRS6B_27420 [Nocardia asteroides]